MVISQSLAVAYHRNLFRLSCKQSRLLYNEVVMTVDAPICFTQLPCKFDADNGKYIDALHNFLYAIVNG